MQEINVQIQSILFLCSSIYVSIYIFLFMNSAKIKLTTKSNPFQSSVSQCHLPSPRNVITDSSWIFLLVFSIYDIFHCFKRLFIPLQGPPPIFVMAGGYFLFESQLALEVNFKRNGYVLCNHIWGELCQKNGKRLEKEKSHL